LSADKPLRLFVAAGVPERHLAWLQEQTADRRSSLPGGRWAEPAAQHVTLKFLGSTPADLLPELTGLLEGTAARHAPASVSLADIGAFPTRRRARVLWMGLEDPADVLREMAADLDESLRSLGFDPEKRAYTPHLTLARFKSPISVPESTPIDGRAMPPFLVDHLTLWRSRLHPSGARYEVVARFALEATVAREGEAR
jgi:RNA 2',3'-cyclic 3'-phosphodiesterase